MVDTLDLSKIKSFYSAKDTIMKMKRQPTEWEKIFTNYISGRRLVTRKKYEEIFQLSHEKTNIPMKQQTKDLSGCTSKANVLVTSMYMKSCSTLSFGKM